VVEVHPPDIPPVGVVFTAPIHPAYVMGIGSTKKGVAVQASLNPAEKARRKNGPPEVVTVPPEKFAIPETALTVLDVNVTVGPVAVQIEFVLTSIVMGAVAEEIVLSNASWTTTMGCCEEMLLAWKFALKPFMKAS